jgi:hypothetical protein
MTCAERLECIFKGDLVDQVPFVLKGWRVPQCEAERELRNDGMGILDSRPVYSVTSPNTDTETRSFSEKGVAYQHTRIRTPIGDLTRLDRRVAEDQTEGTSWRIEMLFKGPEDYDALTFLYRDRRYTPRPSAFLKAREQLGGDAYFKTTAPGAAIHTLMYEVMGLETFSIEWAERRDCVLKLMDVITRSQEPLYDIVAQSPADVVQCGGNYASDVLGKDRMIAHVVPHWEAVADVLHANGKLLGSHLDANNAHWADVIGEAPLDWIEAFSPSPDTDMTVADARAAWPGKVLFINFPSAVHLSPPDVIDQTTQELLQDAAPGDRFIIGVTENVPESCWRQSFRVILDTINACGQLPIKPRETHRDAA